jgi:hypothetical protein
MRALCDAAREGHHHRAGAIGGSWASLMARWSVDMIRKRAVHLGTVVAANEKDAIAVAIKQFEIEPVRRNRIVVTKISSRDND